MLVNHYHTNRKHIKGFIDLTIKDQDYQEVKIKLRKTEKNTLKC